MMSTKADLIKKLKNYTQAQIKYMLSDFYMIGFYQEDKRKSKRQFLIDCVNNCYTNEVNEYGSHDEDSLRMELIIVNCPQI